jgi:hypothetical protein
MKLKPIKNETGHEAALRHTGGDSHPAHPSANEKEGGLRIHLVSALVPLCRAC